MKVALDATYSVGENLSGIGVYSREILHELARRPDAEWVWCYRPHKLRASLHEPQPANCSWRPLFDHWVPAADLFHGLNQRLPQVRCRRMVVTFHDLFVITGDYSTPDFRRRFEQQARDAAARADMIITVSEFTASQVHDLLKIDRRRIRAIPHGVRLPRDPPPAARRPIVLSVGALQRRKNTERLVDAFATMPIPWRLVLAGSRGHGSEDVMTAIARNPRRADITVTGWVDDRTLASWYARASIFAFPSLDEGFGMPVLEAMAWGVPVITSRTSAMPEVAGDAALVVDPQDTAQIAAALRKLASDEALRQDLIRRGLARSAQFTWDVAAQRTWDVYQSLK